MEHHAAFDYIRDLLNLPEVVETRHHMHHSIPKHDHLTRSVRVSYHLSRLLRADVRTCVRAALLHDINSREGTLTTHGGVAARWAAEKGEDAAVCAAIESHMYPLGPVPTSREAWVLVLADKAASLGDIKQFLVGLINGSSLTNRRRLRETDPYYQRARRRLFWRRHAQRML
ncbi:MAG: HD domain-containing protein [Roseiflexus sp.]